MVKGQKFDWDGTFVLSNGKLFYQGKTSDLLGGQWAWILIIRYKNFFLIGGNFCLSGGKICYQGEKVSSWWKIRFKM